MIRGHRRNDDQINVVDADSGFVHAPDSGLIAKVTCCLIRAGMSSLMNPCATNDPLTVATKRCKIFVGHDFFGRV